jgi:hypothetical protein
VDGRQTTDAIWLAILKAHLHFVQGELKRKGVTSAIYRNIWRKLICLIFVLINECLKYLSMNHVLIFLFSVRQNQLGHITKVSVFSMFTNQNTNMPVIMPPIHVNSCKQ